jgi:DNA repair exonuclease SbcCD ATPase subunit
MIVFKVLKFKNFLSTGNYWTEINLDRTSHTLVVGNNGSGKSTMLDALTFTLFGKAFRDINKPQLLNSINMKDCIAEVFFNIGNQSYRIVRGLKPNIFEIYCDNKLVNQDAAARDYQEYLEKFILKLNYKSFTQIVILGSASFVPFMQLSTADRRSIIEDLLDIQIFSNMNTVLKDNLSINKTEIVDNKYTIEKKTESLEIQDSYIKKNSRDNDHRIQELKADINKSMLQIETLNKKTNEVLVEIKTLQSKIQNKVEIESSVKKLNQYEGQIQNNLSTAHKHLSFFKNSDECPTCKQKIDVDFKEERIKDLTEKIEQNNNGLSIAEQKAKEYQKKLDVIQTTLNDIQKKQIVVNTNNTSISSINSYITSLNKQIADFNTVKEDLINETENLNTLKEELKQLDIKKRELIETKSYYEVASTLLKDTGIKTRIIKQYIPIINKTVNKYLSALDFFVNFTLDETFKETIKSRHRDDFSYASFSEGEKQRIDMSLMLTWRHIAKMKNSTNTNLLILDEVFDSSLDANGTEYLMSILHLLSDTNLFVISHKGDILQDKFRSTIRFEKINNFSRMTKNE